MQYAFVNEIKSEPFKSGKGICVSCQAPVIAKCGNKNIHHWAHKNLKECDSWHEVETDWHRNWKNCFPASFREITFTDKISREIHRADIHTPLGVTIEFQNSPISAEELNSRNIFYDKLIWVVNGSKFIDSFEIQANMPDPDDKLLNDYDIYGDKHIYLNSKEEILRGETMRTVINWRDIKSLKVSDKCFPFIWKNARNSWIETKSNIFLDFGDEFLYLLKHKKQLNSNFLYLRKVTKIDFIKKYSKFP